MQAGSSPQGRDFAARVTEIVFSIQTRLEDAVACYAYIKNSARQHGRDPRHLAILPGLSLVIGSTEAEAFGRPTARLVAVAPNGANSLSTMPGDVRGWTLGTGFATLTSGDTRYLNSPRRDCGLSPGVDRRFEGLVWVGIRNRAAERAFAIERSIPIGRAFDICSKSVRSPVASTIAREEGP